MASWEYEPSDTAQPALNANANSNPTLNHNHNPNPNPNPNPNQALNESISMRPGVTLELGTGDGAERVSGGVLRQPAGRLSKTQYNLLVATTTSASLLKDLPPPEGSPRGELASLATLTPARPMTAPQGLRTA